LKNEGAYFDIVSGGELYRLKKIKVEGERIIFAGVGKTKEEIEFALKTNIFMFTVESQPELELIHQLAKLHRKIAGISLRINPDIDPHTHHHITTGKRENKFGFPLKDAEKVIKNISRYPALKILALQCHIGSQITETHPYEKALRVLLALIKKTKLSCSWLDLGGGFGIIYHQETPPTAKEISQTIVPELKKAKLKLLIEPGRFIVGNAGVLVTKVLYVKKTRVKQFVIVDAAMTDLIRPSLYQAFHQINPVVKRKKRKLVKVDVVGPVCETGDFFAQDRFLPEVQPGELLAIMSAGAYGAVMGSNYNSRPRCAEVLVQNDQYAIIREKENYQDLIRKETYKKIS
jgi:diaminopimelate decarboxylase